MSSVTNEPRCLFRACSVVALLFLNEPNPALAEFAVEE